jgi:hypothetical protein
MLNDFSELLATVMNRFASSVTQSVKLELGSTVQKVVASLGCERNGAENKVQTGEAESKDSQNFHGLWRGFLEVANISYD